MAAVELKSRDKFHLWSSSNQYAMALLCWSNTLGNARKFPALFHKYGNVQVLLPYSVVTTLLIIPFAFAELAVGQYSNNGFIDVWRLAPLFRGITWSVATITFFTTHYSLYTTTHAGYYLLKSFETTIPWSRCDPSWATEICVSAVDPLQEFPYKNSTETQSSVEHFYRLVVLSENAKSFAEMNVRLFLFVLATLAIVGGCLVERIRCVEKLHTFLTLTPLVIISVLCVSAIMNQSSYVGLTLFVEPDFEMLLDYQMWADVVNNALTNIGLGMGGLICISAHGKFRGNIYTFAVLTPLCNLITDVLFTLFVYSSLAIEAANRNTTFEEVAGEDTNLLFVKIPAVLLKWPSHQQLWTISYFFYLYITGVRYLIFLLFTLTGGLHEAFHCVYYLRRFSIAMLCFMIIFIMPLYISPIGDSLFKEMENFCSSTLIAFITSIEAIGLFYFYGARRLIVDVHFMLNKKINTLQYIFYVIPVVLCVVSVANFHHWAWTIRGFKTFWIFIIQVAVFSLMVLIFLTNLIAYIVINWNKDWKWILSPTEAWGCSNEDHRKNRELFKSDTADSRFAYRQELYERSLTTMNR